MLPDTPVIQRCENIARCRGQRGKVQTNSASSHIGRDRNVETARNRSYVDRIVVWRDFPAQNAETQSSYFDLR